MQNDHGYTSPIHHSYLEVTAMTKGVQTITQKPECCKTPIKASKNNVSERLDAERAARSPASLTSARQTPSRCATLHSSQRGLKLADGGDALGLDAAVKARNARMGHQQQQHLSMARSASSTRGQAPWSPGMATDSDTSPACPWRVRGSSPAIEVLRRLHADLSRWPEWTRTRACRPRA